MQNDMDYVGFAPVERFENAPEEHRPWDLLPGAKTVVSMSIKMFKGAQVAMIRGFNHPELRHVMFSYRWFAYGLSNLLFMEGGAPGGATFGGRGPCGHADRGERGGLLQE